MKEGCDTCWLIETQRNMKHLFLIKLIEEQQKIRSVFKEFIPHSPHIWYRVSQKMSFSEFDVISASAAWFYCFRFFYDKYFNSNLTKHIKIWIKNYIAPCIARLWTSFFSCFCETTHSVAFDTFRKFRKQFYVNSCKFLFSRMIRNLKLYKIVQGKRQVSRSLQSLHTNLSE